ncbi:HNH endonuclease [Corynebacterium mycetoides]|uniref:HNH endonuclease n=1 Tax=Corynebacterium mycetoides TaxID=38302 RepID=A0A1G9NKH1_9CORY|nr:HNH endonuclease signature motif containing protein [Corynebacterium mycetoides]SDL87106.1 HNH endonuclease [Corynebacterium mycetoides]
MENLRMLVDVHETTLNQLCELFSDPSHLPLAEIHGEMERLEKASAKKAFVDAAFAHVCTRDNAGRLVGGNWASDYLEKALDISRAEAFRRVDRGKDLFDPAPPRPDSPRPDSPGDTPGDGSPGEAPPLFPPGGDAGRKAREDSQDVSAEKQDIINSELRRLTKDAAGERPGIFARAMAEAKTRPADDLRAVVRRMVDRANRKHKPAGDPNAGYDKRGVHFSQKKSDGTRTMSVALTDAHYALIKALLDQGSGPGSNVDADSADDTRLPGQRKFDQLWNIMMRYEHGQQAKNRGAASVVVSVTLDDLANADHTTTFMTNTGAELTCFDLVRLGMSGTEDFILQVDRATGVPLSLGKVRLASVEQRIVALAIQGVCAWTGCSVPTSEAEMHHILSYIRGGNTDVDNLAALCRRHHRWNNDARDGSHGKSHVDRDADSGRIGVVGPDGTIEFNETAGFHDSAWAKLRAAGRIRPGDDPGQPPDPPMFPATG